MALLAASASEPSVALRQRTNLLSAFGPLSRVAPRVPETLGSAAYLAVVRSYLVASILATSLLGATRFVTAHALRLAAVLAVLAVRSVALAELAGRKVWHSRPCRLLRRKVEFEFFVLLLGPGANALILMLFWPGWLLAFAAFWALRSWAGR